MQRRAAYVISFKLKIKSFAAKHKALQLGHTISLDFRGSDCQLCFWGKQKASEHQPTFSSLNIKLSDVIVKLDAFEKLTQLYVTSSFDWGGASSQHNLPAFWKNDLQQRPGTYKKLAESLGMDTPMAKLIKKQLDKDEEEPALKQPGLQLQQKSSGCKRQRTCTSLSVTHFVQPSSFLRSKPQTQQLGRELSPKDLQHQLQRKNIRENRWKLAQLEMWRGQPPVASQA